MLIENTSPPPELLRGRPVLYPFTDLLPDQKLIIPGNIDLKKHRHQVLNAVNKFKKNRDLNWQTTVRIEDNNIVVYRIS